MTETAFAAAVRTAIREGAYQPKSKLDLVLLATLAEKHAGTEVGRAIGEMIALAIVIDQGTFVGEAGRAFEAAVHSVKNRIDPFTNPVYVQIPSRGWEASIAGILVFARNAVAMR